MARGSLVRVRHGVYASLRLWEALPPWDRYAARVHAVAMVHPDAVFAFESASALLGMPVFGDPQLVHVLVRETSTTREFAGVRTHRGGTERTLVELGGLVMSSALDTAVDLARHRHNAVGLSAADAALKLSGEADARRLVAINESRTSKRGRRHARWPLSRATAASESTLEVVSRAVIEWLGFPSPELQVSIRTAGIEDRVDFRWKRSGVIGEADGDLKYDGRYGDPRALLRKQAIRDERLRRHVTSVVHWGWREATTFAPLRSILAGTGMTAVGPEDSAQLYSLTRALSSAPPHRVDPSS